MRVYLIQTSGAKIRGNADPAYVSAAKGPRFCDEPLKHEQYFNAEPYWQQGFQRRRAWQTASDGDLVLLYCTGSVDNHSSQLSHVLSISEKRIVSGEGAWLKFSDIVPLESPIVYATIQDLVSQGAFSEGMNDCGREGFNIREVKRGDLETVRRKSYLQSETWESLLS